MVFILHSPEVHSFFHVHEAPGSAAKHRENEGCCKAQGGVLQSTKGCCKAPRVAAKHQGLLQSTKGCCKAPKKKGCKIVCVCAELYNY